MKKNKANYHNNSMKQVKLYQIGNIWGFDDDFLGLKFEPFVAGASEAITDWLNNFSQCTDKKTPTMIGSNIEFPGHEVKVMLEKKGTSGDGYYYYLDRLGEKQDLWLCPVLSMFFGEVPKSIYIKFQN